MSSTLPANSAQKPNPMPTGPVDSKAGNTAKPPPKFDTEAAKTGSFILQSIQRKITAAAPPKQPATPPAPLIPTRTLKPLPETTTVAKKRVNPAGQSAAPAAKRQKLNAPQNLSKPAAPAAKPVSGGAVAKGPRKLTPEEIEAKRKRAAELNSIFGGININKNSLKQPDKKIDLDEARKIYEAQLQVKIELLEKKKAEMRQLALERKRAAAAANAKGKPGSPKKPGAPSQPAKKVVSLSDLEKRIQSLKAKMTPGTATAAPASSSKPTPTKAPVTEEENDDDLDDFLDDNEDLGDFVVSDEEDWRSALRSITKYNPKKYHDEEDDDMAMEADYADIEREEKRSARIGKREDKIEELREKGLLKKGSGK